MKNLILLPFIFLFAISTALPQDSFEKGSYLCSQKKMNKPDITKLLSFDSPNTPVHKFDVLDYKIYVDIRNCFISPYPKNFTGRVTVKLRVD